MPCRRTMSLSPAFHQQCEQIVQDLRLGAASDIQAIEALPGGVSSDIARVRINGRQICIKCALPQLKVAAEWTAPLNRNLAEYQWLQFVSCVAPNAVPELLGHSARVGGFAMAYLSETEAFNYKNNLLAGKPDGGVAARVARTLGQIHAESTQAGFDRQRFSHADNFYSLRIEPYLMHMTTVHPALAGKLETISSRLHEARIALVHGDVSPKNLLVRSTGPVFLDAECATFGDPSFDVAFFLNHLMLKAVHLPEQREMLLTAARDFWTVYQPMIRWEPPGAFSGRLGELLPALMLARVDGKSPAEYLRDSERDFIRANCLQIMRENIALPIEDLFIALTDIHQENNQ